jgi:hypothetical protein
MNIKPITNYWFYNQKLDEWSHYSHKPLYDDEVSVISIELYGEPSYIEVKGPPGTLPSNYDRDRYLKTLNKLKEERDLRDRRSKENEARFKRALLNLVGAEVVSYKNYSKFHLFSFTLKIPVEDSYELVEVIPDTHQNEDTTFTFFLLDEDGDILWRDEFPLDRADTSVSQGLTQPL